MHSFQNLQNTDLYQYLKKLGKTPAPLSVVGKFLSMVGNYMLFDIYSTQNQKVLFYSMHKAVQIKINEDGSFTTKVQKFTIDLSSLRPTAPLEDSFKATNKFSYFTSKRVILAVGGHQQNLSASQFMQKYKLGPDFEGKVYTSDAVLTGPRIYEQIMRTVSDHVDHANIAKANQSLVPGLS